MSTRARRTLAAGVLAGGLLAVVAPARAVQPSDKHAALPASTGLRWSAVEFPSSRDAAPLTGWWFDGRPGEPVIVMLDRDRGSMGDLLPVAKGFVERGFSVLTFDYRDFGPRGPGAADTLQQLLYASRWVNDAEGALHFARGRAGERAVFAWGQDLGGAVALAAAARSRTNADGVACESLFRTLGELLRAAGLSQFPEVVQRHRFLVETNDEPSTASSGLVVPLHVTLGMKDDVWPTQWTQDVVRQSLSRVERWVLPEGGHRGLELTPGYHDRLAAWFRGVGRLVVESHAAEAKAREAARADSTR